MKFLVILLAASQAIGPVIDLDEEFLRTLKDSTPQSSLISIQAIYPDGTPVHKGSISCLGDWAQFSEEMVPINEAPWYGTDSRGVTIFNRYDDPFFIFDCSARSRDGKTGSNQLITYTFDRYYMQIVVR